MCSRTFRRTRHVLVDGGIVTLQTSDGKTFSISVAAGKKHRLQVKKDGFTTFGEEVEIDAGDRQLITVRLEPLPVAAAGPTDTSVSIDKPAEASLDVKMKRSDYDAIATGIWMPELAGENDLHDKLVFIPEQKAGDVIIRARVKKVTGQNLGIGLRRDENYPRKRGYSAWFNGGDWFGIFKFGEGPNDLLQLHTPTNFADYFEFAFSAVGDILTIYVDGKRVGEIRDRDYRRGSLSIHALRGRSLFQNVEIMILDKRVPSTDNSGFVPLFNRKDLTGWDDLLSNGSEWKVIDGVLEGRGGGDLKPAVLVSQRLDFKNFRLRVKYRYQQDGAGYIEIRRTAAGQGRSGYAIHHANWPTKDRWHDTVGTVMRMSNQPYGPGGGVERKAARAVPAPLNEWNILEVTAVKNRLTVTVNGQLVTDYIDVTAWHDDGGIALNVWGQYAVQFQEVSIEELPR